MEPRRRNFVKFIESKPVEIALGGCILFNMFVLIFETDATADGDEDAPFWAGLANYCLLGIYTVELVGRFYAYRFDFFSDGWNVLDLLVVGCDFIMTFLSIFFGSMPKVSILRAFRLVRLIRAFKVLLMFPELNLLLRSFVYAIKAILWGVILIVMVITIWSILAVQLIHPLNKDVAERGIHAGCERCPRAFSSVWMSNLTIFQTIVAGDSWGTVAVPIVEAYPASALFFMSVLVTVGIAIMNLILAVIVDRAQGVQDENFQELALQRKEEFKRAATHFKALCALLDVDGSGELSKDELLGGFDNEEFSDTMAFMNLERRDVDALFDVLDENSTGSVHYDELATQLFRFNSPDVRMAIIELTKLQQKVQNLYTNNAKELDLVEHELETIEKMQRGASLEFRDDFHEEVCSDEVAIEPQSLTEVAGGIAPLQDTGGTGDTGSISDGVALTRLREAVEEITGSVRGLLEKADTHSAILTGLESALPSVLRMAMPDMLERFDTSQTLKRGDTCTSEWEPSVREAGAPGSSDEALLQQQNITPFPQRGGRGCIQLCDSQPAETEQGLQEVGAPTLPRRV